MAVVVSSTSQHASSSGTKISDSPYRVFLSFRGSDTRYTFADHLYTASEGAGIRTFRDDDEIEKGKRIDSEIKNAIEASQSSVIVFSKDFASSKWCLEEVAMIMNRAKTYGQKYLVLPVFYHVDPAHVRHQIGSFGEAFAAHESKFREGRRDSAGEWTERVSRWRHALRQAADLSGMDLKSQAEGYEAMFIEKIVAEIQGKVKSKTLSMPEHLTGMDRKVKAINCWLRDASENVSYLAICGIGGIGKTTIARHAFNLNCNKFNGSCFLSNVKEAFEKSIGLIGLQRQLLSDISSHRISKIYSADEGISKIKDVVWGKKVLLVLDDVEDDEQLQCLLGQLDFFSEGSKIMVTTRSRNLLKAYAPTIHDVEVMNDADSIQLFSRHAFRKDKPEEGFDEISKRITQQCQGLPLALQVLGSSLLGKEESYWNATLVKLQAVPNDKIDEILRVSYDGMKDEYDRELFLEISCFFVGQHKEYTIMILNSLFHATIGLENLKDRCLLEFDECDRLVMHQMVRDMGREICRKENPNNPGERRRLWRYRDSISVLEEKTGTSNIEALVLDDGEQQNIVDNANTDVLQKHPLMYLIELCCWTEKMENDLETVALKEMQKLRMLHINFLGGLNLKGSYKNFPNKIQWLRLEGWPLKSMPDDFPVKECVSIEIFYSGLIKLGLARTQVFRHLKILNLSYNKGLTKILEFSKFRFPNLEVLNLKECVNLKEVDESIGNLKESLKFLGLRNCTSLRKLPRTVVMLRVLKTLEISGCTNLEEFPENMNQMKALIYFGASGIIMNQEAIVPRILAVDTSLIPTVPIIPWGALPGSLTRLLLKSCGLSEKSFPRSFDNLPFLEDVYLGDNPIRFLPECIKGLTLLNEISFHKCERLESLVGLPEVSTLEVVDCVSLKEVTYQAGAGLKTVTRTRGCGELICLQHKYKPMPINSIGNYLLYTFRFIDWEAMESTNITFYNNTSFATRKGPIQGVEEACGILSIAFPGSQVHVDDKTDVNGIDAKGSNHCLLVVVPSCHPHSASISMYTVTLSFVYSSTPGVEIGRVMDGSISVISNLSKQLKLVFDPSWNGYKVEESDEDLHMTWIVSDWIIGDDKLQPGDVLEIYLTGRVIWNSHVKVKKFACNFRGIDLSQQVRPVEATPHFAETMEDDHIFFYGNSGLRDWD